jgi:hypothetical protein
MIEYQNKLGKLTVAKGSETKISAMRHGQIDYWFKMSPEDFFAVFELKKPVYVMRVDGKSLDKTKRFHFYDLHAKDEIEALKEIKPQIYKISFDSFNNFRGSNEQIKF